MALTGYSGTFVRRAKRRVEMARRQLEMTRSRRPDRDHGPSR